MRKFIIFSFVTLIIFFSALLVINFILTRKLPELLNKTIIPRAEKSTGMEISVNNAAIHLFSGKISLDGANIVNPYITTEYGNLVTMNKLMLDISLVPLITGKININDFSIDNLKINIYKDKDGVFNFSPAKQPAEKKNKKPAAKPSKPTEKPDKKKTTEQEKPLQLAIHKFNGNAVLCYTDNKISDPPFEMKFNVGIAAENITTMESLTGKPGIITINGNLLNQPEFFATSITGKVTDITIPAKASMEVAGTISGIDLTQLGPYTNNLDIKAENISVAIKLKTDNGIINNRESKLILTLENVKLSGKLAKQAKNITIPPKLIVNVPVSGTLENPEINITAAIITTIMKNLGGTLGTMLENTTINGKKLDGNTKEAAKIIGNFLKGL